MWQTFSDMSPNDSCFLLYVPLCNPFPECGLDLRTEYSKSNRMSLPGHKDDDFHLAGTLCLPGLLALMKQTTIMLERFMWQRSKGGLQLIARENWGCQPNDQEEMNLANNYVSELRNRSFPVEPCNHYSPSQLLNSSFVRDPGPRPWLHPWERIWAEDSAKLCPYSWPGENVR